jgi:hypothetical protein
MEMKTVERAAGVNLSGEAEKNLLFFGMCRPIFSFHF